MSDTGSMLFFKKFLKHGTRVASVAPSSRSLALAMCRHVDASKPQVLVELGAGTGPVTKVIVEQMHPESTLIAVEIDEDFAEVCQNVAPKATVLTCDVTELSKHLEERGIEYVDLFMSGLPTPSLPKTVNKAVLSCLEPFSQHGTIFTQLTVMPWVYQGMYRKMFEQVDFDLVVANIPPGGAYHCHKLKADWLDNLPGK